MINFTIGAFIFDVVVVLLAYGVARMMKPRTELTREEKKRYRKQIENWDKEHPGEKEYQLGERNEL